MLQTVLADFLCFRNVVCVKSSIVAWSFLAMQMLIIFDYCSNFLLLKQNFAFLIMRFEVSNYP